MPETAAPAQGAGISAWTAVITILGKKKKNLTVIHGESVFFKRNEVPCYRISEKFIY